MQSINIRKITPHDNIAVARVIRDVLLEHNVPKVGTAYADPQLDYMYDAYDVPKAAYFVVEKDGKIVGGAGVAQLESGDGTVCELQKMYFLPEARGLGLGALMMEKCLLAARDFGYEKCYLETMPYMETAQRLYQRTGFTYLSKPMGNTGHGACPVWMIKDLRS